MNIQDLFDQLFDRLDRIVGILEMSLPAKVISKKPMVFYWKGKSQAELTRDDMNDVIDYLITALNEEARLRRNGSTAPNVFYYLTDDK